MHPLTRSLVASATRAVKGALFVIVLIGFSPQAEARCVFITTPTTVPFGNYSVFSPTPLTTTFTVQIQCNPHSSGTMTLSRSTTNNSFMPRAMANGAERVTYNVSLDASGTSIFGDGQGGTTASISVNSTPQDKNFDIPMYFRATVGEDAIAGIYTDTLTLTIDPVRGNNPATQSFTVTTVVTPECQVQTFSLPFGAYDPIGAHAATPLDATMTVNVLCTKGVQASTSLSPGNHFAAGSRQMGFGTHRLPYNVFTNSGRTTVWNSLNTLNGTSASRHLPIGGGLTGFGRIPAGQTVAAGSYTDTLVATVTY